MAQPKGSVRAMDILTPMKGLDSSAALHGPGVVSAPRGTGSVARPPGRELWP